MEKRYQVFVSSTFADLKDERRLIIQALMEMDCIPAGMELFPAADEEQWAFIRRVIDDCDYYLLLIGGRYGSTTVEGVSYTEKEYDYAVERGMKVIALLHEKPEIIPLGKSELDPESRARLQSFRDKVITGRLVRFWTNPAELPGLVALSLTKTIKAHPAIGWVRANAVANEDLLKQLNEQRKENDRLSKVNASLQSRLNELQSEPLKKVEGLAGLEERFTITGSYKDSRQLKRSWSSSPAWQDIFAYISPYLLKYPADETVKGILSKALAKRESIPGFYPDIDDQDFQTVTIQLKALGLINVAYTQTTAGGMGLFWSLTPQGERLMMNLRIVSSSK